MPLLGIQEPLRDRSVRVDPAVAQERPVAAGFLLKLRVAIGDEDLLGVLAGLGDDPAERIGHEGSATGGIEFWGSSFLADPFGRIIAKAGQSTEDILIADCDPQLQEETRRNWPFLRDRRIDAYGPITQRFLDPE